MSEKGNSLNVLEIRTMDDFHEWETDIPEIAVFPSKHELLLFPENRYTGEPPVFESEENSYWVKFIESPLIEFIDHPFSGIMDLNKFIFSGGIVVFLLDPEIHASYCDAVMFAKNIYCSHMFEKKGLSAVEDFKREYLTKIYSGQLMENLELPMMVGYSSNEGRRLKYRKDGKCIRFTAWWNVSAKPLVDELASIAIKGSHKKFIKTELDRSALAGCYFKFLSRSINSCENKCPDKSYKSIISKAQLFWKDIIRKDIEEEIPALKYRKPLLTLDMIHDKFLENGLMNSIVPMPSLFMRNANTASTSLENNPDIMVIDKDEEGWPVAVARKFGHGAVAFLPSCIYMEDLKSKLSSIKGTAPGTRGWNLLEGLVKPQAAKTTLYAGGKQDNDINNVLEVLVSEGDGLRARKDRPQKLLVKLNTRPAIKVPIKKIIQFLAIWIHSVKGKGIMYCSDNNWNECASKSGYSQIMALNATGNKECVIWGKIIFPDKAPTESHIQYFKRKIISAVIFGKQPRKVKGKHGKDRQSDNTKLLAEIFTKQDPHEEDIYYHVWRLQIKIKPLNDPVISAIEEFMARDEKLGKCKDVFMTAFKDAITSQQ